MTDSLEHLRQWIGRKEAHQDLATAWPIAAMSATLDRDDPLPREGDAIPEGWHWSYFLETALARELAHDGRQRPEPHISKKVQMVMILPFCYKENSLI